MTGFRVAFVDVYVFRGRNETLEALMLRRARGQVRAGSWEAVHGKIDPGETPVAAACRELHEEIGCDVAALYNISRVEQFYYEPTDEVVQIPVFAAFVAADAIIRVSAEHDTMLWMSPAAAREQCSWPRAARSIEEAVRLLGTGDAGVLEDVLRIRPAISRGAS